MTIEERIEALLPRKTQLDGIGEYITGKEVGRNEAIDQCATNLKQAFERGEICFVPSEEKINQLVSSDNFIFGSGNVRAKAILSLLTKGKDDKLEGK